MSTLQTYQEVMKNTTAVPQEFYVTKNNVVANYYGAAPSSAARRTGSIVKNQLKPGSFGFVATMPTGGNSCQRLLTKTFSMNGPSLNRTFEFTALPKALAANRPMQIGLRIVHPNKEDAISGSGKRRLYHDGQGNSNIMPLLVAPGSVSVADDWTEDELNEHFEISPEINWGNVFKGVVKAVPVIADAGYTIYKQVTGGTSSGKDEIYDDEDPDFILGALKGVAKIAAPFLSAIL